jgi:hypothetical protein
VWEAIREREKASSREEFFNKMKEPHMVAMMEELAGRPWQFNPVSLISMLKRVTRGFSWMPGCRGGRMPILNSDQILQLKNRIWRSQAVGRAEFEQQAMEIYEEGLRRTEAWLGGLHHPELARRVREEAEDARLVSRSWVNQLVERCQLVLRAGEELEEARDKWGKTRVVEEWFRVQTPRVQGVDPRLVLNGDECGVAIKEREKLVCIPGGRLFRLRGAKLPHFTVFPVFNCFGHGPLPFIVMPRFASVRRRFERIHPHKAHLTDSRSGWVTAAVFREWAEWVCQWLEGYRRQHGLEGHPAALFLDNAPTRSCTEAMRIFRAHLVRVILLPPHLTHVLQPVDVCWAKQFKAAMTKAFQRYGVNPAIEEAAFQELGENLQRAAGKHRLRVRMIYAICEASAAVTCLSSAAQGFAQSGLVPWCAEVPLHYGEGYARATASLTARRGTRGSAAGADRSGMAAENSDSLSGCPPGLRCESRPCTDWAGAEAAGLRC